MFHKRRWSVRGFDRSGEPITALRDRLDPGKARVVLAEHLAEQRDVLGEIALDKRVRPDYAERFFLLDYAIVTFQKRDQQVHRFGGRGTRSPRNKTRAWTSPDTIQTCIQPPAFR
jgi:hypothetical protein